MFTKYLHKRCLSPNTESDNCIVKVTELNSAGLSKRQYCIITYLVYYLFIIIKLWQFCIIITLVLFIYLLLLQRWQYCIIIYFVLFIYYYYSAGNTALLL